MGLDSERRQYPRSVVNLPVTIQTSENTIFKGETRNISSGGAYIQCEKPPIQQQIFCVTIHMGVGTVSFTTMAELIWSTTNGIGIRFHPKRPEDRQLLSEFITEAQIP